MYVANIMSTAIITAAPWLPSARLVELLVDENIGAIPVVDDSGLPMGLVTRADVLEEEELAFAQEATAAELMRRCPITVTPETFITHAARIMTRHRIHHLLVLDDEGELVGMLSSFDVVKWVAQEAERGPLHHPHG